MEGLKWLQEGLAVKESLNGDNKYFCDVCLHLVEAERTLHYHNLPPRLTLHLNRSAASSTGSVGWLMLMIYTTHRHIIKI